MSTHEVIRSARQKISGDSYGIVAWVDSTNWILVELRAFTLVAVIQRLAWSNHPVGSASMDYRLSYTEFRGVQELNRQLFPPGIVKTKQKRESSNIFYYFKKRRDYGGQQNTPRHDHNINFIQRLFFILFQMLLEKPWTSIP